MTYNNQYLPSPIYSFDRSAAHSPNTDEELYTAISPTSDLKYQQQQQQQQQQHVWSDPTYNDYINNDLYSSSQKYVNFLPTVTRQQQQPSFGISSVDFENSSSQLSATSSNHSVSHQTIGTPSSTSKFAVAAVAAAANAPLPTQQLQLNNPRDFISAPSRTVYLGNIPPFLPAKQLLDHVRSGVIEELKILPDRMCAFISFVDESSALLFHSDAILKRLNIEGRDIKVGWGKPTPIDPIVAAGIASDGATRNVYIGRLNTDPQLAPQFGTDPNEEVVSEEKLRKDLNDFGEIESIKIVRDKGIAFVHFSSIFSAIKVVSNLASVNPYYTNKKIFYGKDRCAFITKTQQHNAAQFLGLPAGMEHLVQNTDRDFISSTLLQQSAAAAAIATSAGGANNLGNRTVYLGNLPKDVKIEEICNAVRGGLLQSVKLLSDRHVCFVTFIDPTAAAQFYAMSSLHGLTIHNKRCKIGWGKHSGSLPNALALAVSHGASRNIYVGNIDFNAIDETGETIFTEQNLRETFQEFGEVEQINFLHEKNCCFINFTNISNAILAIDKIKCNPYFKDLKVNFGKDRCGNVPRQFR